MHQGRSKHQDSRHRQCALASGRYCRVRVGTKPTSLWAEELTECLPEDSTLIGDKACDSSTLRQAATRKGINTCIPGRSSRTTTVPFSARLYRHRHQVEDFFERIKRYRRVATRYDKAGRDFPRFCLPSHFVHSSPQINDLQTDPRDGISKLLL